MPVDHAKAYPYFIPGGSYVLYRDGWRDLPEPPCVGCRHAVVAAGSNASPDRLAAKFAPVPQLLKFPIPVLRARLYDFDAVYSAHVSRYGAIPATLARAPGAAAELYVTLLTDEQLEHMHDSEAVGVNYDFIRLDGARLEIDGGDPVDDLFAYLSRRGCLNRDGQPVALSAITTENRLWPAMNQEQILDHVRARLEPETPLDDFIRAQIDSEETRARRTEILAKDALRI
ncbi:MAG: hypothetical protein HQL36_03175 [Alphaproteobacteria bacterium]|nr:hypothetical protein [Alphaproteobacteria bacterium]